MAICLYKSFGYQFEPLTYIGLTNTIYKKLDSLKHSQTQYWCHFERPSKNLQQQLTKKFQLPKMVWKILFSEDVHSRCVKIENGYILIIQGVQPASMQVNENFPTLRLWITKNGLLSISTGKIQAVQDLQKSLQHESEPTLMQSLVKLLEDMLVYLEKSIYQLDERLSSIEEHFEYSEESTHKITSVRQDIIFTRRYILPQKAALIYFSSKFELASENIKSMLKELNESMFRQVESIELLRERSIIIQDNLTNKIGEIANKRMYLLTIIMLIFTPAFFIMGMFSMYLPIPGMNSKSTWWIVVALILVVCYSQYKLFKMKKWL